MRRARFLAPARREYIHEVKLWVFVSGTTGFDYKTMSISDDLPEQTEQCLKNIESALREAGSSLKDVVRVPYVLPDGAGFEQCWPVPRRYFGEVRPAAMMISAGLADPAHEDRDRSDRPEGLVALTSPL